jgi:hypothetical protein
MSTASDLVPSLTSWGSSHEEHFPEYGPGNNEEMLYPTRCGRIQKQSYLSEFTGYLKNIVRRPCPYEGYAVLIKFELYEA